MQGRTEPRSVVEDRVEVRDRGRGQPEARQVPGSFEQELDRLRIGLRDRQPREVRGQRAHQRGGIPTLAHELEIAHGLRCRRIELDELAIRLTCECFGGRRTWPVVDRRGHPKLCEPVVAVTARTGEREARGREHHLVLGVTSDPTHGRERSPLRRIRVENRREDRARLLRLIGELERERSFDAPIGRGRARRERAPFREQLGMHAHRLVLGEGIRNIGHRRGAVCDRHEDRVIVRSGRHRSEPARPNEAGIALGGRDVRRAQPQGGGAGFTTELTREIREREPQPQPVAASRGREQLAPARARCLRIPREHARKGDRGALRLVTVDEVQPARAREQEDAKPNVEGLGPYALETVSERVRIMTDERAFEQRQRRGPRDDRLRGGRELVIGASCALRVAIRPRASCEQPRSFARRAEDDELGARVDRADVITNSLGGTRDADQWRELVGRAGVPAAIDRERFAGLVERQLVDRCRLAICALRGPGIEAVLGRPQLAIQVRCRGEISCPRGEPCGRQQRIAPPLRICIGGDEPDEQLGVLVAMRREPQVTLEPPREQQVVGGCPDQLALQRERHFVSPVTRREPQRALDRSAVSPRSTHAHERDRLLDLASGLGHVDRDLAHRGAVRRELGGAPDGLLRPRDRAVVSHEHRIEVRSLNIERDRGLGLELRGLRS